MGFWDRKIQDSRQGAPPARPQPRQQSWPRVDRLRGGPLASRYAEEARNGYEESFEQPQDYEGDITPETHPQFFQIGPDGRLQRSVWSWRGDQTQGAAKFSSRCPECGGPNYLTPRAKAQDWQDGSGATTFGVTTKDGHRVLPEPRCMDCGYPKLQQGSGKSLSGRVIGSAPSASGATPMNSVGRFDSAAHKYVPIG